MSKWNPIIIKCNICGHVVNNGECNHSSSEQAAHSQQMKEQKKADKKLESLVKRLVDEALKERGL